MSLNASFIQRIKELSKNVKVLLVPSPYRILNGVEWRDHDTAAFYRKWLESGQNLDGYYKHQQNNFPLFLR